jgi:hypothetical protein
LHSTCKRPGTIAQVAILLVREFSPFDSPYGGAQNHVEYQSAIIHLNDGAKKTLLMHKKNSHLAF